MSDQNIPSSSSNSASDSTTETMSTAETLGNIFFDPGATFESLRKKPRFLVVALIMVVMFVGFSVLLFQKVNFEEFMRQQIEKSPRTAQMTPEQKEQAVKMQSGPIGKTIAHIIPVVAVAVLFSAGAGLYLLGVIAMGGVMSYKQAISVWAYSSLPPAVLGTLVGVIVLLMKPADSIDLAHPESITQTNLGVLASSTSGPVYALLSQMDLFQFYGLFLAALGLKKVGRISSGTAWTIVLAFFIIKVLGKVGWASMFG
jgi:Yip1 domain